MARVPCILCIGQSNMQGQASLGLADPELLRRWFGLSALPSTFPFEKEVQGINYWTMQHPIPSASRNGTFTADTANSTLPAPDNRVTHQIEDTGATFTAADVGRWLYLRDGTYATDARKIVSFIDANNIRVWPRFKDGTGAAVTIPSTTGYTICESGSQSIDTYTGKWLPMRLRVENALASPPPLWTTGYEYSNLHSSPQQAPLDYANILMGPDLQLGWKMRRYQGKPIWVIKLGVNAMFLTPQHNPILPEPNGAAWWDGGYQHVDWSPSSTTRDPDTGEVRREIYGLLVDKVLVQAKAGMAVASPGDELDIIGVFLKEGESDSILEADALGAYDGMRELRDQLRADIQRLDLSAKSASDIPWIIGGHDELSWPYGATFNEQMRQLANEDKLTRFIDTSDRTKYPPIAGDEAHIDVVALTNLGDAYFDEWLACIKSLETAADVEDERPTLSDLRSETLRRYERNDVGNDATNLQVDSFINDALREFFNTIGENAYWLRQIETINPLNYPSTTLLPDYVYRVLRLERQGCPGEDYRISMQGYDDKGQIRLYVYNVTGPATMHYMVKTKDLVTDGDRAMLPTRYKEVVVLMACKRLAESYGNQSMLAYWNSEIERVYKYVKRDILRADRARHGSLTTGEPEYDGYGQVVL